MPALEELRRRLTHLERRLVGLALALVGAPGIGKSHTAHKALSACSTPNLVVQANISDAELARAWLDALGARAADVPTWAVAVLERCVALESLPPEALMAAQTALLRGLAPFALLVEDAHEASALRWEQWCVLARALPKNAALLMTSRVALPEVFEQITFAPLTPATERELLNAEVSAPLPTFVTEWITERSQGNPLFALEYLRDLRRRGALSWRGAAWQWEAPPATLIPNTLEALVEGIVQSLPDDQTRTALEAYALLDDRCADDALWAHVADLPADQLRVVRLSLERFGILRGRDFTHGLFAEVTRKTTSATNRREQSGRALSWLEGNAPIKAVRFIVDAEIAGDKAAAMFRAGLSSETDPLRRARLQALAVQYVAGDERFAWALEAAKTYSQSNLSEAARLADIALTLRPQDFDAINIRAQVWVLQGQAERGKALLKEIPLSLRSSRWWGKWCHLLLLANEDKAAWETYQSHPELKTQLPGNLLANLARYLIQQGLYDEADAMLEMVSARADLAVADRLALLASRAALSAELHRKDLALKYHIQGFALVEASENSAMKLVMLANRAMGYTEVGRYREAEADYERVIALALELGNLSQAAKYLCDAARTDARQGRYAEAERRLLEARDLLETLRATQFLSGCEVQLADLYLIWQPPHGRMLALKHARASLRHALMLGLRRFEMFARFYAARAELESGRITAAQDQAAALHSLVTDSNRVYLWWFVSGLIEERLGNPAAALLALRTAITECADPNDEAVLLAQLELHRIGNDVAAARVTLRTCQARGYMPGVTIAERYFPIFSPPSQSESTEPTVRLEVLGGLRLRIADAVHPLRGAKRKALLALLLDAQLGGCAEVRSNDLGARLYPNAAPDEAKSSVKQLVFQLRAQLGANQLVTTAGGYALRGVTSDAEEFLETGNTKLWRGAYLADIRELGSQLLEPTSEALYAQLRLSAATLLKTDIAEASRITALLLEADPFDADALTLTLRALQMQGNFTTLAKIYAHSKAAWLEVGERLPERWVEFLATTAAAAD